MAAGALAAPALAYLPPAGAILRREAQRREDVRARSTEVSGSLVFSGESAQRAAAVLSALTPGSAAAAAPASPGATPGAAPAPAASPAPSVTPGGAVGPAQELTVPAILLLKTPGRCRIELAPPGIAPRDRPMISIRAGHTRGVKGLDTVPAARAMVEALCTLLGDAEERGLAQRLAARGVALTDVAFGRMDGRVAWVLGGRPQEQRPQAWIDKEAFQPVRLVAPLAGATRDVRLLDFGSIGGDAFPRAVEVWNGNQIEGRFTTEKVALNPRLPEALF
jgi:hypothetical protein